MGGLEVLLWILAGIGGVILFLVLVGAIAFVSVLVWGFRLMRDDEAATLPERANR